MPPVLTHTSLILNNWHRLDPSGPVRTDNLACNCRFLGGLDETWFYIATVEIEARGGGVFGALLQVGPLARTHARTQLTTSKLIFFGILKMLAAGDLKGTHQFQNYDRPISECVPAGCILVMWDIGLSCTEPMIDLCS